MTLWCPVKALRDCRQGQHAHLDDSGGIGWGEDGRVVIHVRNLHVDGDGGGHCRRAAVKCLDSKRVAGDLGEWAHSQTRPDKDIQQQIKQRKKEKET